MVQGLLLASSANLLVGRAATAADIPSPSALPRTDMPSIEVHVLHDLMSLPCVSWCSVKLASGYMMRTPHHLLPQTRIMIMSASAC